MMVVLYLFFVFFFKQKTAYEMRISVWSSDVFSSDLLIGTARRLYADEPLGVDLAHTVYALDSSTIDLCLSVFPLARAVHAGHGGIKLHTLLDIRGAIPTVLHVTPAQQHDVHMLDRLVPETG